MGLLSAVVVALAMIAGQTPSLAIQKREVEAWRSSSAHTFAAAASRPSYVARHAELVWTTDGCSNWFLPDHVNDTGASYDFTDACWHHDFEYRNERRFVRAGLVTHPGTVRKAIDAMFRRDMRADCAPRPVLQRTACFARADLYYRLVRRYGTI